MKHLVLFILVFSAYRSQGQYDTTQVSMLLEKIYSKQVVSDSFYDSGLFPTHREWKGEVMEDNTFFYTASISYLLQNLYSDLPKNDRAVVDTIVMRANRIAWKYANRKGEASYNFWQTYPDTPHPNGKAKHQRQKHGLPDDLDDSAMMATVLENDSINQLLRSKMVSYARSNNHKPVRKAAKGYQKTRAYRTWFADKWAQDLDVVVLCNVLLFVFENDFPLNEFDSASIDVIRSAVSKDYHINDPENLSPYYGRTSLILYHLARTLVKDSYGVLDDIKAEIVEDLYEQLPKTQNEYEKVMLLTSLYRLGQKPNIEIDERKLIEDADSFYFFYSTSANISLAGYKLWIIKTLGLIPSMYWKSEAFNMTLLLEFLVETNYSFQLDPLGNPKSKE